MKSPWKYLAGLASLGRTAKEPANPAEAEPLRQNEPAVAAEEDTSASLGPTDHVTSAAANVPDEKADLTEAVIDPIEINEPASAAIRPEPPRDEDHALEGAPLAQPRTVQRGARKASARRVAVVDAIQPKKAPVDVRPPPPFSEQVATLDQDIRQLRQQLSEKLRLQNDQLERLLKRFDAS